jgi:hypothetical protein
MPTALEMPWPSGPVDTSIAGCRMFSGWPAVLHAGPRHVRLLGATQAAPPSHPTPLPTASPRVDLSEPLQLVQRQVVPGEVQHGVQQRARVPVGQHEPVTVELPSGCRAGG